jgi:hypothetical protein
VRDCVLDDHRLHLFRVSERHAKSDRTAVVLHVERIPLELQLVGEIFHDFRKMVKGVAEVLGGWP